MHASAILHAEYKSLEDERHNHLHNHHGDNIEAHEVYPGPGRDSFFVSILENKEKICSMRAPLNSPGAPSNFCREPKDVLVSIHNLFKWLLKIQLGSLEKNK